jgi:predicted lysophospholipase L1 biosynthesis ABC-type transport system permease subunit
MTRAVTVLGLVAGFAAVVSCEVAIWQVQDITVAAKWGATAALLACLAFLAGSYADYRQRRKR